MMILKNRYGGTWICINLMPEEMEQDDYFDGLNGGDNEHIQFMEKDHDFPMGIGNTPNKALECFEIERDKFNIDIKNYKCNLEKLEYL